MGNLLRNREVRRYFLLLCLLGTVGLCVCFWLSPAAGVAFAGAYLCLLALTISFTKKRYEKIAGLSDQLSRIAAGDFALDIKEYTEGELSILASELLKITRTLSHQAQALQKDKTFLQDSLADISHQLKTPLTSVSMMVELLSDPGLSQEKRQEFLRNIRTGLERIQWLISSLLKLSRLDAGAVVFKTEPVALSDVLEHALSSLRIPMEIKNLTLVLSREPDTTFIGDRDWLVEALGNLLKNCVEHTPEGGRIAISWSQNPLYTQLLLEDSGTGIDKDDLPHVFERFYRGKNAGADSVGIGLALTKSILQHQGGSIAAENNQSGGTRFLIKLYSPTSM